LAGEDLKIYGNHVAAYAGLVFSLINKRLTITPQLRVDMLAMSGYRGTPDEFNHANVAPEPRLAVRYQLTKWLALKAAIGVYHQPPQPGQLSKITGNPNLTPELGFTYVFGVESDPTRTLHVEAQAFYKDLRQLVVAGEHFGDPALVNDGQGRVYGGELLVRQELWHNFFGWIAYTVSRSERQDHPGDPWRIFQFDQTHIFTLIASYKLPRGYQVGLRFRYVTGDPYTPVASPSAFFDANNGSYRAVYGPVDAFHQLDVRFDKAWTFDRWKLSVYLDLQNLYNNRAPESVTYNFNDRISAPLAGLPIIPDLGIRGDF
jgi:hypothetical protein